MAKVTAIINQKGGVGKTTTAVNLAAGLALRGKKALLCDFDPQSNATSGLGVTRNSQEINIYDVIIRGQDAKKAIKKTQWCDVLPSSINLAGAEIELVDMASREFKLKEGLKSLLENYEYILIDCPPSLGLLTLNALTAADTALVPIQCEYYALEGLSQLINTIKSIKKSLNPALDIEGIVLTMYDGRTNLSIQVSEEIKKHFGSKVYPSLIPRNIRLSEAPSHGKPIMAYDKFSRGSEAYQQLVDEFLERNKKA